MKFYSEMLKKFYDTQTDCETAEKQAIEAKEKAETKAKALVEQRASRAKEVENAYKNLLDARKAYIKVLNDFCKDYGSYHFSITGQETDPFSLFARFFEI